MIIDFHTHIFPAFMREDRLALFSREPDFKTLYTSSKARLSGAEDLIRTMDDQGVHRSVVFGFPWRTERLYQQHNDYILSSVAKHPDRLIGFACFSMMSPGAAKEADRCLAAGLGGVGELAVYDAGLDQGAVDALSGIMALCVQYDVPVLLHVNEPVGHRYPGKTDVTLAQVYHLIRAYPENRIVLAHWGGGLFFYALMKKEVAGVLKNVWFDTAASPYLYQPEIYKTAGRIIGYEKILLGSDYPLLNPNRYFEEMESTGLERSQMDRINGLNARGLLSSLSPRSPGHFSQRASDQGE